MDGGRIYAGLYLKQPLDVTVLLFGCNDDSDMTAVGASSFPPRKTVLR